MIVLYSCSNPSPTVPLPLETIPNTPLKTIKQAEVDQINSDIVSDKLTIDVAIIMPSNFDSTFKLVSAEQMLDGIKSAKEIFAQVDVQINLLWLKTAEFATEDLAIMANKLPSMPNSDHLNAYTNMWRRSEFLSEQAEKLFERLIPQDPNNSRTIYIIVLQEVFFNFYAETEAKDFEILNSPTSGLSFPPYIYGRNIPDRIRGVISISNLTRGENKFKTIAHEIGHKAINVSHEYKQTKPGFEVIGEGGLMIYGTGVEIPSGKVGRYHKERLHLSPFVYKSNDGQEKVWNPDFEEKGHYFDPIYGDKAIRD